ncbi:MAG: hypothetical protein AB1758_13400, partial [Candidatus Eremiobacterota bacterium]
MIETLVASAILMLLLGGVYLLLVGGMRYYQQARSYRAAQQDAQLGLQAIVEEVQDTRAGTVVLDNSPPTPHVIFLSANLPYPNGTGPIRHEPSGSG